MHNTSRLLLVAWLTVCATAHATDLNLTAHVDNGSGSSTVTIPPDCTIGYTISAETSDALHEGLAVFGFDLSFDAGDMVQAQSPTSGVILAFNNPNGITNPAGYGGTLTTPLICSDSGSNCAGLIVGDQCGSGTCALGNIELLQVGGGQNTILNGQAACALDTDCPGGSCTTDVDCNGANATCVQGLCSFGDCISLVCEEVAPLPTGLVTTMVGMPGSPVVVASGEVTVPLGTPDGVYLLRIKNTFGYVIRNGETGLPFWAVDQVGTGATTNLTVTVQSTASCPSVPVTLTWQSIGQHGPNCLFDPTCGGIEYGLNIPITPDASFSESRSTGVNKVVVTYDQDVNVGGANVSVSGCNIDGTVTVLTGITMSVVSGASADQAVMLFSPSLPGNNPEIGETAVKYEITLDGVTGSIGAIAAASEMRIVTAIAGDANPSPITVNNGDLGFVRTARDIILARPPGQQVIDPNSSTAVFEIRSDINNDNTVSNADVGFVRSIRDGLVQPSGNCP